MPPAEHELYDVDRRHYYELSAVNFDVGLRVSYIPLPFIGVELEGGLMPASFSDQDFSALLFHARGHLIGQYPIGRVVPFLVAGYGILGISSEDAAVGGDVDGAFHAGLGVKFYPTKWLALRLDGRVNISGKRYEGGLAPYGEVLLGVSYVIGYKDPEPKAPADSDGDGYTDDKDKCPQTAGVAPDGCPVKDGDGDGVPDDKDKCPKVPADTPDGCPPDKDGDGITDDKDQCPDKAGPKPSGCPDKDGDGILDKDDTCPEKAAKNPDGCPDSDGDGLTDPNDKCPQKPETKNGYNDSDGCPDTVPKKIKPFTGAIKGITFATDKATIRKRSHKTLDAAVKVLKQFPELKLQIRGHTDDRGAADHNQDLSRRRAEAVKAYMIKKGIDASRLTTEGVGSAEPVDPAKTRRARAKNRRIEFKVTQ